MGRARCRPLRCTPESRATDIFPAVGCREPAGVPCCCPGYAPKRDHLRPPSLAPLGRRTHTHLEQISGLLGDRLKVRVSAPPEGGKANKAICQLLARTLGLKRRDIEVIAGKANAEKVVTIRGIDSLAARARLGLDTQDESDSASPKT